jgi:hypothetical protein
MVEPISTGAAVVAVGGWFANKLLGPTADALGEQLKIYAGARLTKIFSRAEQLGKDEVLNPLPPAFAYLALQKASFSEDSDVITNMWAALLLGAGRTFKSRHATFVDILSAMTSNDAKLLNLICSGFENGIEIDDVARLTQYFQGHYSLGSMDRECAATTALQIMQIPLGFPGYVLSAGVPYHIYGDKNVKHADHIEYQHSAFEEEADALVRHGLVKQFRIVLGDPYVNPHVEGIVLTKLGAEFFRACGDSL